MKKHFRKVDFRFLGLVSAYVGLMVFALLIMYPSTEFRYAAASESDILVEIPIKEYIFSDVSVAHKNAVAIEYLKSEGIFKGYEDGSFKPDGSINRTDLVKVLVKALGEEAALKRGEQCFSDVPADVWFAPYVCRAKELGWVNGYSDGSFKPAENVQKAEALKIVLTALNFRVPSEVNQKPFADTPIDQWYTPYVFAAWHNVLLEEYGQARFYPKANITRAGIAELIYRAMFVQGLITQ